MNSPSPLADGAGAWDRRFWMARTLHRKPDRNHGNFQASRAATTHVSGQPWAAPAAGQGRTQNEIKNFTISSAQTSALPSKNSICAAQLHDSTPVELWPPTRLTIGRPIEIE